MTLKQKFQKFSINLLILLSILPNPAMAATGTATGEATKEQMQSIQNYIKKSWHTLMRSNARLAAAAVDPKFQPTTDGRWLVYVPSNEDTDRIATSLNTQMSAADFSKLELRRLPDDARAIQGAWTALSA